MPSAFLDSNILIYTASGDPQKAAAARKLIFGGGVISVQVLNETANVARHKMRLGWDEIDEFLLGAREMLKVEPITIEIHELGLDIARRHKIATYDSLIVAAALIASCDMLYSEDMQHDLLIDGQLRVINPFLAN